MSEIIAPIFFIVLFVVGISVFLHFVPLGLWISAIAAGVRVSIVTLVGMRLRRVPCRDGASDRPDESLRACRIRRVRPEPPGREMANQPVCVWPRPPSGERCAVKSLPCRYRRHGRISV